MYHFHYDLIKYLSFKFSTIFFLVFRSTQTIVTDVWVDLITIWILTQWTVPRGTTHPKIEICKNLRSKEHIGRILLKSEGKRNPNLLALLCDLRNETDITFGMRASIVFRGLPPYNTLAGK